MVRVNIWLSSILILCSLAQAQSPVVETTKSTSDGCVLKHIIYDERPTNLWLVYATKDGKEVQLLSRRNDLMKAAKDCKTYLKEQKDASNKKSKN